MVDQVLIKVRKAKLADLKSLLPFEQLIIQAERPYDSTLRPDPISYYDISQLINGQDSVVYVAELDGNIIASGYAKSMAAKDYYLHDRYAYLGMICVLPEFRGQRILDMIIKPLIKWSAENGLHEIRLEVYDSNRNAIKAYERLGFKKNIIEMRYTGND